MPFSTEALVMCLCALGVEIWITILLRCRDAITAILSSWCALICAVVSFLYLVRWFALP